MKNSSNLVPFANNGLELVIDTETGESFASQSAVARMCEVDERTIRRFKTSAEIEFAEKEGYIEELYAIAIDIFG